MVFCFLAFHLDTLKCTKLSTNLNPFDKLKEVDPITTIKNVAYLYQSRE